MPSNRPSREPLSGGVYFEFIPIGRAVKVIAICSVTGHEVAIVGDSRARQSDLERLALRRLQRKLGLTQRPQPRSGGLGQLH